MRAKKHKEKGWPSCERCELWLPISCECKARNENGETPCRVMSKKLFDYMVKAQEE